MSQCKKFSPNIFHKSKCSNCFRQKEEHSAEALECNRASRSIARSGYLFVAPDWDFSVPLNRTKRWQRRWFVLYDDGELNYSVDEHPDTIPQGSVDMTKVMEVTGAEQVTGHPHSLALTSPDRVTFVKAASREDARWWAELLAVFPRRHKRNATFPGGRASPSLPQLGRSASPQPPRPRHLSVTGPSPRTNFETPPLKEERESPPKDQEKGVIKCDFGVGLDKVSVTENDGNRQISRPAWLPDRTPVVVIENAPPSIRKDEKELAECLRTMEQWGFGLSRKECLVAELNMSELKASEYKADVEKLTESLREIKEKYFQEKKANHLLRMAARNSDPTSPSGIKDAQAQSQTSFTGGGFRMSVSQSQQIPTK